MTPTKSAAKPYRRVLLKLSGEAFGPDGQPGLDGEAVHKLAKMIAETTTAGVQLALVVGGGNIWRYRTTVHTKLERSTSDTMGMLATVINAVALQNAIEQVGVEARVQTALSMPQVAEPYIRRRAIRHLEKERVVIFAAGSGDPYFTTDTAAALRALEIDAEVLLKGTKVNGVYDSDPAVNPKAKRFEHISYKDVLVDELAVMDGTAISLCRENSLPLIIFDVFAQGALADAVAGKPIGTKVEV